MLLHMHNKSALTYSCLLLLLGSKNSSLSVFTLAVVAAPAAGRVDATVQQSSLIAPAASNCLTCPLAAANATLT